MIAVSYTHLDVYKRQPYSLSLHISWAHLCSMGSLDVKSDTLVQQENYPEAWKPPEREVRRTAFTLCTTTYCTILGGEGCLCSIN